jgi:L-ascorbate metabolism protein UlaG (beta-lactamase superfamily)
MGICVRNLGHSCFLFKSLNGINILTDPFLSENKFSPIRVQDLPKIDIIVVSHGAFDHLGDTVEILRRNSNAKLFCGPDVALHVHNSGIEPSRVFQLVWGTSILYNGIDVRSIEARHLSFFESHGQWITGIPMSFIIRMEDSTGIYFSGDTSIFSDLRLFGKLYPVKIGLFCMDGLPGYPFEMNGCEAALAAELLGVKFAIPMHFPPGSSEPMKFKETITSKKLNIKIIDLEIGESYIFNLKKKLPNSIKMCVKEKYNIFF